MVCRGQGMIDGSGQVVWALVLLEEEWIEGVIVAVITQSGVVAIVVEMVIIAVVGRPGIGITVGVSISKSVIVYRSTRIVRIAIVLVVLFLVVTVIGVLLLQLSKSDMRAGLLAALSAAAALTCVAYASPANNTTLYDFHDLIDIEGRSVDLASYRGNVSMVINVASF
eukprot:gene10652-2766_t